MITQGYLKSTSGIHVLQPARTTVGKASCDIILEDNSTDQVHAVIEFCASEDCFVLHDLNSSQGSYVNDCRVQNAAVRLAAGDVIKFGHNGKVYELQLDNANKVSQHMPVQQRPSWNSPIQIVVSSPRSENNTSLPLINLMSTTVAQTNTSKKSSCVYPHPPLHCRLHASNTLQQTSDLGTSTLSNIDHNISSQEEWVASSNGCFESVVRNKEKKIVHMGDEINRLAIFEQESHRKDSTIACLREELAHLQDKFLSEQQLSSTQVFKKLQSVEKEILMRRNEVAVLRQQLDAVNTGLKTSPTLTSQLAEHEKKIHSLRQDLDKSRKEYCMSQGLVQSLQKEIQTKEITLKKINTEFDHIKKELKKKDIQLSSISSKFTRITEDKTKDDLIESLKKESKDLKIKLRTQESRATDQVGLLQTYKEEIVKLKAKFDEMSDDKKTVTKQSEEMKQKYYELQRKERILRVDLEQSQSRLDRFRMRILHKLYSAPGLTSPDDLQLVEDNTVINDMTKIIANRSELKDTVQNLQSEIECSKSYKVDMESSKQSCVNALETMMAHILEKGHHARVLKNQADLLLSLSLSDESVCWVYKTFASFLHNQVEWTSSLDEALHQAGYDTAMSDKNPSMHVSDLYCALEAEKRAHQVALGSFNDMESQHHKDLQSNINKLLREHEEKLTAEIEVVRMEEKAKYEESLKKITSDEEERRIRALNDERERVKSANVGIEQLQKMLSDKQSELELKMQQSFENIEKLRNSEKQLQNLLSEKERNFQMELLSKTESFQQIKNNYEIDIKQYKEEIRQHSITIVSMEKQIQELTKQYQKSESKVKTLAEQVKGNEKRTRIPTPPPRSPINDASEQEIAFLKSELLHASHEINMQQNTITALRRDLSGVQARVSDMTGELSESQKQELEYNRNLCKNQETELNTIRQKLLKMSRVVDSQKDQIENLQKELRKQESVVSVRKSESSDHKETITDLQSQLASEKLKVDKQTQAKTKEGQISLELSSVGAQCRGDRHDEVISRQREALAELRARIKALEQIRPPLPSQEQALQQVILLKKELAEIRAKQAIEEDKHFQAQMSLDQEVVDSQHQIRTATTQASIERTSRVQLQEGFEASEKNYFDMVNSISSLLGVSTLHGSSSMQHAPQDEREKLSRSRKLDIEHINGCIKSILQQLDRKEQLLQGYEKDLGKLREAEHFASQKSSRVETLSQQLMTKSEETDHLREALAQTNEALELEKRLNKSIKQRQTFYLENLDYRPPPAQALSSYQSEMSLVKKESNKKKRNEKMKRKQYEINILKQRVHGKERELCNTTAKLMNLGTSTRSEGNDEIAKIYNMLEKSNDEDLYCDT